MVFIETADLLACGILHLGAVSTVLEYHNIVPLGFCDQMGLDETEETSVAASVIVFPALMTEWFKNIIAILNPCAEAWRQLNNTFPGQGDDLPCL